MSEESAGQQRDNQVEGNNGLLERSDLDDACLPAVNLLGSGHEGVCDARTEDPNENFWLYGMLTLGPAEDGATA